VYLSSGAESPALTAGSWYLADADLAVSSTLPQSVGVAVSAIAINTSGTIRLAGTVTTASAVVVGSTYYVSATAGAITSTPPLLSRQVGVAITTSSLLLAATTAISVLPNPISQDVLFVDATYDIGKAGANRPRDFFQSRNATIGGTLGVTGLATLATLGVTGAATLSSTLGVTGVTTLTGGLNTALTVPNGGTGVATQQAYGVLVGGTTATGVMQSITPGTSGYVLTSAGTGALPTWSAGRATETAAQTSNYTLALTDDGLVVLMNVTGSSTLTVPPNSSVAFASGTVITVYNMSASNCVITAGSGVTIRNLSNGVVSQYGEISMRKRDTNEWVLVGAVT
jgi:hypothetical protein